MGCCRKTINISTRLLEIAKLVKGPRVADVGCDGANLAIWLAQNKNVFTYACDLRSGPLKKAEFNIKKFGVCDQIKLIQTDGLDGVSSDVNEVIISGLGGEQIEKIVHRCVWLKNSNVRLILQPQSLVVYLKQSLSLMGFAIENQVCVTQGNKVYLIFVVKFCGVSMELSLNEALIGGLQQIEESSRIWVKAQKQKLERVLGCLKFAKQTAEVEQKEQQIEEMNLILEEWLKKAKV